MPRQRQTQYIALIGVLLLSLLTGMFLFGKKRSKKQAPSDVVASHHVKASADETLAYWTGDKKREASPMPLPVVHEAGEEHRKSHSEQSSQDE